MSETAPSLTALTVAQAAKVLSAAGGRRIEIPWRGRRARNGCSRQRSLPKEGQMRYRNPYITGRLD